MNQLPVCLCCYSQPTEFITLKWKHSKCDDTYALMHLMPFLYSVVLPFLASLPVHLLTFIVCACVPRMLFRLLRVPAEAPGRRELPGTMESDMPWYTRCTMTCC